MGARYDQRVAALVEVRGGPHDWAEAEGRFEAHGWPVRGHHMRGTGPTFGVLDRDPAARVYEVEVRLPGAARGCARGAAYRLAKVLRGARLEAYVRRTEPIVRDREVVSRWQVFGTAHRPAPPVARWRRRLARRAERMRRYDTGAQVSGRPGQALRLARTDPAAGYDPARPVAVRPLDSRWRELSSLWPEEEENRRIYRMVFWALATVVALVFGSGRDGFGRWFWYGAALAGLAATLLASSRLYRTGGARGPLIAGVALLWFGAFLLSPAGLGGRGPTGHRMIAVTLVLAVVAGGLWLLVRQWTWGEWAAWVIPLLVTLGTSSFITAGSLLHALYADSLGLSPDDLGVPAIWQLIATLKLVELLSIVMALPAAWGYARHYHWARATPGDGFNGVLYLMLLTLLLGGGAGLALNSAQTAVDRTTAAAHRRAPLPGYFGIRPRWTCVEPVVPAAQLPGEGPRLDPAVPYLSFGVSGGTAILWDPRTDQPLKVPADHVRLLPARSADLRCGGGRAPAGAATSRP